MAGYGAVSLRCCTLRAVKILRLTTSNDSVHSGPDSRVGWIQRLGEERLGEPVQVVTKAVWPDARLAPAVEKWIEKEQPDLVWMLLQSFWYEYLSVPKKLERKFGRAGKAASEVGFKAADKPLVANNFAFRAGRRVLQKTVGGDPHFTSAELYETVEAVARIALRSEGRQFVVWGPFSYTNYAATRKQERSHDAWRSELIARVRALSADLHFYFEAPDRPYWQTEKMPMHGDHFHFAAEVQRDMASREVDVLERIKAGDTQSIAR
jgi:hypothetical protein